MTTMIVCRVIAFIIFAIFVIVVVAMVVIVVAVVIGNSCVYVCDRGLLL